MANEFNNPTFGVELECYIRFRRGTYGYGSDSTIATAAHRAIRDTLNKAGVPARTAAYGETDYSKWLIEFDSSLSRCVRRDGYENVGVEIVTRVLHHKVGYGSKTEVRKAFRALNRRHTLLTNIGFGCTGLHVHVGNSRTGLSAMTAKKLAAMVTALEPVINRIIVPTSRLQSVYCRPPSGIRRQFGLGTLQQQLSAILAARDSSEVIRAAQGTFGHQGRYAQVNLLPLVDPRKRTIEFRYFAGTTNADEIVDLVDFVVALVRFAATSSNEQWFALIQSAVGDPTFTIFGLVRALNVRHLDGHLGRLWRANGGQGSRRASTGGESRLGSSQGHRSGSSNGWLRFGRRRASMS